MTWRLRSLRDGDEPAEEGADREQFRRVVVLQELLLSGEYQWGSAVPTDDKERRNLTKLLSITQVAEILGVEVRHVRRLVAERRIPYIKWGHLLRFDPDEFEVWIDQNRRQPVRTRW